MPPVAAEEPDRSIGAHAVAAGLSGQDGQDSEETVEAEPGILSSPVVDRLDDERQRIDAMPLRPHAALQEVAERLSRRLQAVGTVRPDDLSSHNVSRELVREGYHNRTLVVAFASGADPEVLAEQWPAADKETWKNLLDPALRDVGLAGGDLRGSPFQLVLAAVSQGEALEAAAASLQDLEGVRWEVLRRTNALRGREGLRLLHRREILDQTAQDYADRMFARGFYGHVAPEGDDVMDRVRAAGYLARRAGENLAQGPPTAELAVDGWSNSPDHRANLLESSFRHTGLGVARGYADDGTYRILWVQIFAAGD